MSRKKRRKQHKKPTRFIGPVNLPLEGALKMSAVILKLVEPLLEKCGGTEHHAKMLVALAIVAWNKAMQSAEKQAGEEAKIINQLEPKDGDMESVEAIRYVTDVVEKRRKKFFPNLRRIITDYDLQIANGKLRLNVVSGIPVG